MRQLPTGEELLRRLRRFGISPEDTPGAKRNAEEPELQRRLEEYYDKRRIRRTWIIALVSACASVVSAVTAIIAVLRALPPK